MRAQVLRISCATGPGHSALINKVKASTVQQWAKRISTVSVWLAATATTTATRNA